MHPQARVIRKRIEVFARVKLPTGEGRDVFTEEELCLPGSIHEAVAEEGEEQVYQDWYAGRVQRERVRVRRQLLAASAPETAPRRIRAKYVELPEDRVRQEADTSPSGARRLGH